MKLPFGIKLTTLTLVATLSLLSTSSYGASATAEAQIDATVAPCLSQRAVLGETDVEKLKENATALLEPCYNSMLGLDFFEKANPDLTPSERNYLFYQGGYVIWLTAAAEVIKNDSNVSVKICNQVGIANSMWSKVSVPEGHQVEQEINNYPLRPMLISACKTAFAPQN